MRDGSRFAGDYSEAVDRLLADTFAIERMFGLGINVVLWKLMDARLGVPPLGTIDAEFVLPVIAYGEIVDLVSWPPTNPAKWQLHHGLAVVMGEERADRAALFDEPLRIFSTPLAWLLGFGEGASILDWSRKRHLPFHLSARRLLVDDARLANRINRAMASPPPVYQIKVAA